MKNGFFSKWNEKDKYVVPAQNRKAGKRLECHSVKSSRKSPLLPITAGYVYPIGKLAAGKVIKVCFTFSPPRQENGDYSAGVSFSTGKLVSHPIPNWNHHALTFTIESGFPLSGALIDLSMESITCRELE